MLDARFPPYSPGSRRLYDFEDASEQALLTEEVRRTFTALEQSLGQRITKGSLTREDANALLATWRAIAEDLEAQDRWLAERARGIAPRQTLLAELVMLSGRSRIAWTDKVAMLRREIEARRTGYPAQVDKGTLTRDQASQQLERIEAVHDLYWRHGYAFDGTRDELRAMTGPILDYDVELQGAADVAPATEQAA